VLRARITAKDEAQVSKREVSTAISSRTQPEQRGFQTLGFHCGFQQNVRFSQLHATLRSALRRSLFHQKAFKVITLFCQPHTEAQVITVDC
jgi:hypothetical protein